MAENPHVRSVEFIKSAANPIHFPETLLPEIAIAGRSNVGKSSLINKLVNRRRIARVSNTPGRTQLLNFFVVNDAFTICDLPGYGYAKVPRALKATWGKMIETYLLEREPLRALILLMDVRRTPGDFETDLIHWCSHHGHAVLPVVTKVDKLSKSKRGLAVRGIANKLGFQPRSVIGWSAVTGEGLDPLWRGVVRLAGLERRPITFGVNSDGDSSGGPSSDGPSSDGPSSDEASSGGPSSDEASSGGASSGGPSSGGPSSDGPS
ncbi:MAG: GTP-binding protein [Bradymonadia bacterium]|jgi:GTP-binding protein